MPAPQAETIVAALGDDAYQQEASRARIVDLEYRLQVLQAELARHERAAAEARKSEDFSRRILESSPDCIKILDTAGHFIYLNPRGLHLLGLKSVQDLAGRSWVEAWDLADRARAAEALQTALDGGIGHFEGPLTFDDRVTWWDVKITPMHDAHGNVDRLVAVSRETTELKLAHAALMQSERFAVAGRLAATVAHEINNPLEAITNFVYLARTTKGIPSSVRQFLTIADQEIARVATIAQQTLGFYRDTTQPGAISLADVTRSVVAVYERKLDYKLITLTTRLDDTATVVGRKGDLKQVLSNLITNAIDATPARGRILIHLRRCHHPRTGALGARLSVADTGSGMSPEVCAKAFGAFFTTKAETGTGIGLWVTRNLVERDGGYIRCRSRKGEGTVMSLFLPLEA